MNHPVPDGLRKHAVGQIHTFRARMSASANSFVVCGPLVSAAEQMAHGSPHLNNR
jgi:hypothetical protein